MFVSAHDAVPHEHEALTKLVTLEVFQFEMSGLQFSLLWNIPAMLVIFETSQFSIGLFNNCHFWFGINVVRKEHRGEMVVVSERVVVKDQSSQSVSQSVYNLVGLSFTQSVWLSVCLSITFLSVFLLSSSSNTITIL